MKTFLKLGLGLFISLLCHSSIYGQKIYVDSASTCTNCTGTSWATAYSNLQNALSTASNNDTILVAKGTYYPDDGNGISNNYRDTSFVIPSGIKLLGGYSSTTGLRDWKLNKTILSGEIQQDGTPTNNSYHVLFCKNLSTSTLIEGFIITQGCANGSSYPQMNAGGAWITSLSNTQCSPTIQNCVFHNNYGEEGGAIRITNRGQLKLNGCLFYNNSAINGGAINNYADYNIYNIYVSNCTFVHNQASSRGGAIFQNADPSNSSHIYFRNCIIWNNTASSFWNGNEVYNYQSNYSYPIFKNCIVKGCQTSTTNWYYSLGTSAGGNFDANPLFNDSLSHDFSLNNCSPAINQGYNSGVPTSLTKDLNGQQRIFNSTVDIGAFECQVISGFSTINSIQMLQSAGCNSYGSASITQSSTSGTGLVTWDNGESTNIADSLSPGEHTVMLANSNSGCLDSATIFISSSTTGTRIYVDSAASGLGNGCSWNDAIICLQDAIDIADPFDSIFVAKGTYYPDEFQTTNSDSRNARFLIPTNVALFGGFSPTHGATEFNQRNMRLYETILSGNIQQDAYSNNNSYNVVKTVGVSSSTIVDGFVIQEGNSTLAGGWLNDGTNTSSDPQIRNCIFRNNDGDKGAALHNIRNSKPLIVNCIFHNNKSLNGGAIYNDAYHGVNEAKIINCTFVNNYGSQGGAITNYRQYGTLNLTISNSIFWGNTFNYGSYLIKNSTGVSTIINNCITQGSPSTSWISSLGIDGGGNLGDNPLLLDTGAYDFRVGTCSKAIDAGKNTSYLSSVSYDMNGAQRIYNNNRIDIGAFETQGNGAVKIDSITVELNASCSSYGSALIYSSVLNNLNVIWDNGENTLLADSLVAGNHSVLITNSAWSCYDSSSVYIPVINNGHMVYVDANANGLNSGCTWQNAFTNLQDALINAKALDTILVAEGTYYPGTNKRISSFHIPDSVTLLGGFSPVNGISNIADRDFENFQTILSGEIQQDGDSTNNTYHVVYMETVSETTCIDGFIITLGYADSTGIYKKGGGLANVSNGNAPSSPVIRNCIFINNYAFNAGGGIYNYGRGNCETYIENCRFINNIGGMYGGGVCFDHHFPTSYPKIVNCLFFKNYAEYGGGIYTKVAEDLKIYNCTFHNNTAQFSGGAIYNMGAICYPLIQNCILYNNLCPYNSSNNEMYNDGTEPIIKNSIIVGSGGSSNWNTNFGTDGGGNLDINPNFIHMQSGDLRLRYNSPAINSGSSLGLALPQVDLSNNARVVGLFVDIGCYEYNSSLTYSEKDILEYHIPNEITNTIDTALKKVHIVVPNNTNLSNLIANFILSPGALGFINNIQQQSNVSSNDYTSPVIFEVQAIDFSTKTWTIEVELYQGINNNRSEQESWISIFPNPTQGIVMIESKNPINNLEVFDAKGNMVIRKQVSEQNLLLDLSSCSSGVYYLQIQSKEELCTRKIILY
jgi:predicted outer membrane repeat protein